ncbi:MAG: hypothetical protein ACOY0T_37485 [Myxococcota bacterium]
MSQREASVKLTLDNGQFIVSVRKAGDAVEDVQKKSAKSASAWTAGLHGARDALGSVGGKLKEVLGVAAGLGGAFSLGKGVQEAISMRSQFMAIETQINKTGRATVTWRELMSAAEKQGAATGHTTAEMAAAMEQSFAAVGDADFAINTMQDIGDAAKYSNKSLSQMTGIAGMLNEKFGATAETLPDMLAVLVEKTDEGGLGLEAMGEKFGLLAGEAADAGYTGAEGLSAVIGMLSALDDRLGDKSIPSFKKLFQLMKDGSASLKALEKESGIKLEPDMKGLDKLRAFMSTEKGRKAVTEKLGGEARVVFDELSKPFNDAFKAAKESGKSTKEATNEGLQAFDQAMAAMSKHALSADDVHKRAQEMVAADPAAKLHEATDKFVSAISTPEMFNAMDKLAAKLPEFAEWIAKLVEFATNHPLLAGAGAAVAVGGGGMVQGATGALAKSAIEAAMGSLSGGAAKAGLSFAATAFGPIAIAGAAGLLAAGIIEALAQHEAAEEAKREKEREQKVVEKGKALTDVVKDVAGMSEKEAVEKYGEQGGRFKRGQFTPEEQAAIREADVASRLGISEVDRQREREKHRAGAAAEYGLDEKLGIGAPGTPDQFRADLGRTVGGQPTTDLLVGDVKQMFGAPEVKPAPGASAPKLPPGPAKVKIEDQDSFAQALAREFGRTLATTELKVRSPGLAGGKGALPIIPAGRAG